MPPIRKPDHLKSQEITLPVMEHFYTIQGEGINAGIPAYFIRLAGCDVGCVWCDVKDSWDESIYPLVSTSNLTKFALHYPARICVITGGEPLIHNLDDLCEQFQNNGFKVYLETSGAYQLSGKWDWICVSPKKFKRPLTANLLLADELKIIIYNKSDFIWAKEFSSSIKENCQLLLQPEHSQFNKMMPGIIDFVKNNPEWRISLQTHKIINVP